MGLMKILIKQKKDEQTYICQNCKGMLYPLEGSVENIFVCESCGQSYDYESIKGNGSKSINKSPIYILFNEQFMRKYTKFICFDEFINECPITSNESLDTFDESIPFKYPKRWDKYVKKYTSFSCWNEMFEKAIELHLHI